MKRQHRKSHKSCMPGAHPCADLAAVWALRILLDLEGWRGLMGFPQHLTADGVILQTFGLGHMEDRDFPKRTFLEELRKRQDHYEGCHAGTAGNFEDNLTSLVQLVGLTTTEREILTFAVVIYSHEGLNNTGDTLKELTAEAAIRALSVILDLPLSAVRRSLSADGMLAQSGLLRLARGGPGMLHNKLELLDGLVDVIFEPHPDSLAMLSSHFHLANAGTLQPDDFSYIRRDFDAITTYLGAVRQSGKTGVNILIYGEPGTGKSELARTLAAAINLPIFEVNMADGEGSALSSDRRFFAYRLSQQVLSRQAVALVLFDEIEDVFNDVVMPLFGIIRSPERRKAWISRLLENNPVPAIWISNTINQIDPAFLRRFDYTLELNTPPRQARERVLKKYLGEGTVSARWIHKIAENPVVAPALVSRAARVAAVVGDGTPADTERQMEHLLEHTLKAMGHRGKLIEARDTVIPYRLDVLNADRDIPALVAGLQRHPVGRICLYGLPGTGKTAFGRYTADALDKPLLCKRASDLLGPYVGMTETHIANMFTQAREDGSVLLLDEADSFLTERQNAQCSWEVTQVNELLTQMEGFDGLFICSTNLVDKLDSASLRRFDLKIKFDYLNRAQRWTLFREVIRSQGKRMRYSDILKKRLDQLGNLTPGDFATVVRQNRLSKDRLTPARLLDALVRESKFKRDGPATEIGFTASL